MKEFHCVICNAPMKIGGNSNNIGYQCHKCYSYHFFKDTDSEKIAYVNHYRSNLNIMFTIDYDNNTTLMQHNLTPLCKFDKIINPKDLVKRLKTIKVFL